MLKFVVESACHGRFEDFKERVVGSSVFGREIDYDTNQDAVVRNAAADVRKRLAQYYLEHHPEDTVRIDLPTGSYQPEFRAIGPARGPGTRRGVWWVWVAAVTVLVLVGFLAGTWIAPWRPGALPPTELDRFWRPLIHTPGVVQVLVGQSRFYFLPDNHPNLEGNIAGSRMQPMRDRFLYFGDSICLSRINGYLQGQRKDFRFRGALTTPYSELRGQPVVLIGVFNNEWNLRLTSGLRFSLAMTPEAFEVHDKDKAGKAAFSITRNGKASWDADEDYVLISRIHDPNTENWVIAAGGITSFGTMAAGEFLSNPSYIRDALRGAPQNWERRNIQAVLQTHVVEGTPGPPKVLAVHFW